MRIGINVADIIVEGDGDIFGDGFNLATRAEAVASETIRGGSGPAGESPKKPPNFPRQIDRLVRFRN
jgi:hypothetical protein